MKLSLSKKLLTEVTYNLILTVVNQLIKKVRFLPYKEASDAKELTYTFLQNVTVLQELSNKIISSVAVGWEICHNLPQGLGL